MPSLRFIIGLVFTIYVCCIGWRARNYLPPAAQPILFLVWASLFFDLAAFGAFRVAQTLGSDIPMYEIPNHIYTIVEFAAEIQFLSLITEKSWLRSVLLVAMPVFTVFWVWSEYQPLALVQPDTVSILISQCFVSIIILTVLFEKANAASLLFVEQGKGALWSGVLGNIWANYLGKIFIGLLVYNFFSMFLFVLSHQSLLPPKATPYLHSLAHGLKHTCFLLAFLQHYPITFWRRTS